MHRSYKTIKHITSKYKVVQIWPGQTVTCLHTNSPGHIWTTLYFLVVPKHVKFALEQAMKVQRVSRGIALSSFFNLGNRRGVGD
jgi:hypothetical protein